MKTKTIIFLTLLFLLINGTVYLITKQNAQQRIKLVLDDNLKTLKTHYEILLQTQKTTALALYQFTINSDRFKEIISQAKDATKEKKAVLRDELQKLLAFKYDRAKQKGVLQYHFILADNESFLRMHKPEKFGDDLTYVRDDFRYTNKTKKPVRVFTQGRTAHGFRNTFPLFDKNAKHIGAMEISFSSDSFQWFLNNISQVHTHFLVDKSIFDANTWERDDLIVKYTRSAENLNYMITLNEIHTKEKCIIDNMAKLEPVRQEIDIKMLKGDSFSLYVKYLEHISVVSFLPIKNLKLKSIAWLVSYEESPFIELTLKNMFIIRLVTFLFSLILIYFIAQELISKRLAEEQHKLLNDILNSTDNIMFITDFKDISFSNYRFKNMLDIKHNILDIFIKDNGYIHRGLLKDSENFSSLIKRTPEDERIVSVLDKHYESKFFKISISETNTHSEYLVTLSDITELKAKHDKTKEKVYLDGLTGIYNRNKFDEVLDEEIKRVKRYNHPLSMAVIDIDKFKDFNDTYGHLVGDEVLIAMAQSINNNIRDLDMFARWGGEEFVILFRETSVQNAEIISQKLKDIVEELDNSVDKTITISLGLTEYLADDTAKSIFKRCDEALYLAKENGRNRIEVV